MRGPKVERRNIRPGIDESVSLNRSGVESKNSLFSSQIPGKSKLYADDGAEVFTKLDSRHRRVGGSW